MTYHVYARERGASFETLVCSVGTNPQGIVKALRQKRLRFGKRSVPRYEFVGAREVEPASVPPEPPEAA